MRILLIPAKINYPAKEPSLDIVGQGFPYIAAALSAAGHEIQGLNFNYRWLQDSAPLGIERCLREKIDDFAPQLICVGGLSADYAFVRDVIVLLRALVPQTPILGGGGMFTYDREFLFSRLHPDYVLVGDAEETVIALTQALHQGTSLSDIPNLSYWCNGVPCHNPIIYSTSNLDTMNFPDYQSFDYASFLKICNQTDFPIFGHTREAPRIFPITIGRSCPYACTFCVHTQGQKYRARSITNVMDEIEAQYERYQFNMLMIYDELFSAKRERCEEFCDRLMDLRRRLKTNFDWYCTIRVNDALPDLLHMFKTAGCVMVGYGLESGSQAVLDSMKKGYTVDQLKKAIQITSNLGLGVQGNFIYGDIAETPETAAKTISFIKTLCQDCIVSAGHVTPYPGSSIFQHCLDHNLFNRDSYYKRVGAFGHKLVNMTQMPDAQHAEIFRDLAALQDLEALRHTEVVSWEKRGLNPSDVEADFSVRRTSFRVTCNCPHCLQSVSYVFLLRTRASGQTSSCLAICSCCHKRFSVSLPYAMLDAVLQHPIEQFKLLSAPSQASTIPVLVEEAYEGFNIVKLGERYHALLQSLGPIDLGGSGTEGLLKELADQSKCVSADSIAEIKDRIVKRELIDLKVRAKKKEVAFSIIIPTRNGTVSLKRFLDSLLDTALNIYAIEVVLVLDEDDAVSVGFSYQGVSIQKVIVKPGLSMGALNTAGYKHAVGHYIMLMNDDVIIRTPGWDQKVLAAFHSFHDEVVLVHTNDKIFEDKLCTFPFVSRKFCEMAGGICPEEYARYRIDDHIYNIFNLLAVLGQRRILYLPEVVFEHLNRSSEKVGGIEYRPDERIHRLDTETFERLLESRKRIAVNLMKHIDLSLRQQSCVMWGGHLSGITDSVSLRKPEYVRIAKDGIPLSSENTRVTIGLVSADIESPLAKKCLNALKQHTKNFDLIVLDNNRGNNFNHPVEMNRLLSVCRTEYLVLLDDDVFVEGGWLDGMLRCMTLSVGVVTPMHKNKDGAISYAGIVMRPDFSGHHAHIIDEIKKPTSVQTVCSAVMLIDMTKCGHIKLDESFSKYFLDIDYGCRIWEAGFQVVCSPFSIVTHVGGGTLPQGSQRSNELYEEQRKRFVKLWTDTGRLHSLAQNVWQNDDDLSALLANLKGVESLKPQLIESGYKGFNIIQSDRYYAILQNEGAFDLSKIETRGYSVVVIGGTVAQVRSGIDNACERHFLFKWPRLAKLIRKCFGWSCLVQLHVDAADLNRTPAASLAKSSKEKVCVDENFLIPAIENYRGFLTFKYEYKFFAVDAQKAGAKFEGISSDAFRQSHHFAAVGHSLPEVRLAIDRIIDLRSKASGSVRRLVLACIPDKILKPLLQSNYDVAELTIFAGSKESHLWQGYHTLECGETSLRVWMEKHSDSQKKIRRTP